MSNKFRKKKKKKKKKNAKKAKKAKNAKVNNQSFMVSHPILKN